MSDWFKKNSTSFIQLIHFLSDSLYILNKQKLYGYFIYGFKKVMSIINVMYFFQNVVDHNRKLWQHSSHRLVKIVCEEIADKCVAFRKGKRFFLSEQNGNINFANINLVAV